MKPNPYESSNSETVRSRRNGVMFWYTLVISFLFCAIPTGVAVYAWMTHWEWQRTGAYAGNSFPMNKFASDATWVAGVCFVITVCSWGVWAVFSRKHDS